MEREIFSRIRTAKGWKNYKLAKELGISIPQLKYQEKTAQNAPKKLIKRLFELASECGISAEECAKLL